MSSPPHATPFLAAAAQSGATVLPRDWDRVVADLAGAQHGVVARRQLLDLGMSHAAIDHRIRRGRLHVLFPGVYAVGHTRLAPAGRTMAAVLAGGPGAAASHRSAAALWGLLDGEQQRVSVAVLRTGTPRAGVRWHRVRQWDERDRATVAGIPVTSPARTALDLAPRSSDRTLDRLLRRMEDLRLFDLRELERVMRRRAPGVGRLRQAVAAMTIGPAAALRTKAELERRFLELLVGEALALPATNVLVATPWATHEVDAFWAAQRLVIELDGWETHRDREAFRRDHRRTADLTAAGFREVRLTWEQVVDQPAGTAERLRQLVPPAAANSTATRGAVGGQDDAVGRSAPRRARSSPR
ncbi:type IV toxin-antitoxin system AbiEi family antitoxin domain-containing protein [Patulibacter sp. SYSU D01012]|uniref:type IV toxin-antitoxin system AbiEi family antitoxin domain-containing protein n=1 Tax=Patulibacter sp. SYSU D01012 TaxID=2817381 RepID=UPI001B30C068|nr:type IV toxin-antitoxin system AbiEi family antitoxin domain-containing protein [Patulibacter sp. SYSU D01012]